MSRLPAIVGDGDTHATTHSHTKQNNKWSDDDFANIFDSEIVMCVRTELCVGVNCINLHVLMCSDRE